MPKVTYTSQVEKITGKMGGSILKGVKSGSILRRGQRTRQPHSPKQQQTRALYNRYAGLWYQLSDTEKAMWHKFASLLPQKISGLNAYIQHNVRLIKARHADLTPITSPPQTPSTPEHITGHEVLRIAPTTMRYQWTGPSDTSNWVELYWAVAVAYDFTGKQKWTHVDTTRSDENYIEWTNDYPLETPIHTRARTIDPSGRVSPWTDVLRWEHGVPAPIGTECVLYLPIDEGAGTTAFDHSPYTNNATIDGPTWVPGTPHHALFFDGLDDKLICLNAPSLNFATHNFSIELRLTPLDDGRLQSLIAKALGHPSLNPGFDILYRSDTPTRRTEIRINDNVGARTDVIFHSPNLGDGNTHHLVITADRDANGQWTTDGNPATSRDISAQSGNMNNTANLHIGANYSGSAWWTAGLIHEIRIYSRLLTSYENYDHFSRLQ